MEDQQQSFEELQPIRKKRPRVLTVFCILSFLGGSYYFSNSISGVFNADEATEARENVVRGMDEMMEEYEKNGLLDENTENLLLSIKTEVEEKLVPHRYRKYNAIWLFASICTLTGAFLIFTMRKIGVHLYIGGTIIFIAGTFLVFGSGWISWGMNSGHLIFGSIFSTVYLAQMKHLH